MRTAFQNAAEPVVGRRPTVYCLRHSCATGLLEDGLNVKAVSERLGHASVVVTLKRYVTSTPAMQEQATEVMAARLYG